MASAAPAKVQEYTELFTRIGLAPKFAAENAKSDKAVVIAEVVSEAGVQGGCDKSIGNLLHLFATTLPANRSKHRAVVSSLIAAQKIKTNAQVAAAVAFLKKLADGALNKAELEKACGVGVEVSPAQIAAAVRKVIDDSKAELMEQRYSVVGKLLGAVNRELQWADGKAVKDELDKQVGALLGPMTEEDTDPAKKKAALKAKQAQAPQEAKAEKKAPAKPELTGAVVNDTADNDEFTIGRDLEWAHNTPQQLAARKAKFGDTIITRFPPEPNGFLHLGHAKAMYFDFGVATQRGGGCILRFDDTNPAEEKQLYIDKVIEACGWLGHKPSAITFSSDYFQELYDLAVKLIKKGLAYVCRQTGDEIEESRKQRKPSPWRDRPIEENLIEFERMKRGYYDEGYCTLRMKGDIYHPMPCMWDLIAYRIKYIAHPHAGDGWCIYPSYDYTHCIIDSIEGVSYSLCTLEFETRRESYFWLLHVLELYKPKVWEYSRLNVEYNVMSKRKLKLLVEEGHVKDWDDPRLLTLMGLRRRGVPPEAINLFCSKVGISRNTQVIRQELFDFCVRQVLNESTPRAMVVQDPIKVTLTNYPAGKTETLKAPVHPMKPERGSRDLPFSRVIYIDREDFRVTDDPSFYRLAPGKTVHLLYAYNITCTGFTADPSGKVTHIEATVDLNSHSEDKAKKIKGKLHWVAEPKPGQAPLRIAELRQYAYLFKTRDCSNLGDDWREHIDRDSLLFLQGAFAEPSLKGANVEDKFQFERLGFYCVDSDSKPDQLIFNRTITLRDNKGKDEN